MPSSDKPSGNFAKVERLFNLLKIRPTPQVDLDKHKGPTFNAAIDGLFKPLPNIELPEAETVMLSLENTVEQRRGKVDPKEDAGENHHYAVAAIAQRVAARLGGKVRVYHIPHTLYYYAHPAKVRALLTSDAVSVINNSTVADPKHRGGKQQALDPEAVAFWRNKVSAWVTQGAGNDGPGWTAQNYDESSYGNVIYVGQALVDKDGRCLVYRKNPANGITLCALCSPEAARYNTHPDTGDFQNTRGTSFAAPTLGAIFASIESKAGGKNRYIRSDDIVLALQASAQVPDGFEVDKERDGEEAIAKLKKPERYGSGVVKAPERTLRLVAHMVAEINKDPKSYTPPQCFHYNVAFAPLPDTDKLHRVKRVWGEKAPVYELTSAAFVIPKAQCADPLLCHQGKCTLTTREAFSYRDTPVVTLISPSGKSYHLPLGMNGQTGMATLQNVTLEPGKWRLSSTNAMTITSLAMEGRGYPKDHMISRMLAPDQVRKLVSAKLPDLKGAKPLSDLGIAIGSPQPGPADIKGAETIPAGRAVADIKADIDKRNAQPEMLEAQANLVRELRLNHATKASEKDKLAAEEGRLLLKSIDREVGKMKERADSYEALKPPGYKRAAQPPYFDKGGEAREYAKAAQKIVAAYRFAQAFDDKELMKQSRALLEKTIKEIAATQKKYKGLADDKEYGWKVVPGQEFESIMRDMEKMQKIISPSPGKGKTTGATTPTIEPQTLRPDTLRISVADALNLLAWNASEIGPVFHTANGSVSPKPKSR
jgi:hypothetical protein